MLRSVLRWCTSAAASLVARVLLCVAPSLGARFGTWYRALHITHPRAVGPIAVNVTVRFPDGRMMNVPFAEELGMQLISCRDWQPIVAQRLAACLTPGDIFVDVGANMGYFSLLAAVIVKDQGLVIAVEPAASNLARLAANVSMNDCRNVAICSTACSNSTGIARLSSTPWHNSGLCTLREVSGEQYTSALTVRLDALLAAIPDNRVIRAVKIDVEGFEPQVIAGMVDSLAAGRIENIVLEASPEWFSVRELVNTVKSSGFACEYSTRTGWALLDESQLPEKQTDLWFSYLGNESTDRVENSHDSASRVVSALNA